MGIFTNIKLLFAVGVVTLIGIFAAYFFWSQSRLETMAASISSLQIQVEIAEKQQAKTIEDINKVTQIATETKNELTSIKLEQANALKVLNSHNLTNLANSKPKLIENKANAATANLFKKLEELSREK